MQPTHMKEPDSHEAISNDRQPPSTEHTNMPQDGTTTTTTPHHQ